MAANRRHRKGLCWRSVIGHILFRRLQPLYATSQILVEMSLGIRYHRLEAGSAFRRAVGGFIE